MSALAAPATGKSSMGVLVVTRQDGSIVADR